MASIKETPLVGVPAVRSKPSKDESLREIAEESSRVIFTGKLLELAESMNSSVSPAV